MYAYKFDEETDGILLTDTEAPMSKEPRPVMPATLTDLARVSTTI